MKQALLDRLRREMEYEFAREGPPEGFPKFPDLPAGRYTDPAFFELEMTYLWPKCWLLAGRVEDVATPGSYMLWEDIGVPILIVHGTDGVIRAFYNSCRHRGAPVVRDKRGNNRALRCQYHSWTYDTSGRLLSVPDERDFVDLCRDERGLMPVRCEIWDGWIFVNQDPEATPLLEFLGPIPEQLAEFQGPRLRQVHKVTKIINCNWKVTCEAFLEVYHFKHIHSRGGEAALDNRGATMGLLPNGCARMITPFSEKQVRALGMSDWSDWRMFAAPNSVDLETVNAMVRSTSTAYNIFPNLITPLASGGFPFLLAWPVDVGTTRFDYIFYGPAEGADASSEIWQQRLAGFDIVMEEDWRNLEPIQKSLSSPGLPGVPINYQERRIWHFNEEIDRVIGLDRIPEPYRIPQLLAPYVTD